MKEITNNTHLSCHSQSSLKTRPRWLPYRPLKTAIGLSRIQLANKGLSYVLLGLLASTLVTACSSEIEPQAETNPKSSQILAPTPTTTSELASDLVSKPVVYQVFTRLFGNKTRTNQPWGTKELNGVGKFSDFDDRALESIKQLGVSHIWFTGVPHHALVTAYPDINLAPDDPDVVKGRAGSPYAVKDYYNVNPDLADDPKSRLAEFEALIERTHNHGMKVIIDIVPNHVARNYLSFTKPEGVRDFGADDDVSLEYAKHNDFYYIVNSAFSVPDMNDAQKPLGGEAHPLADGYFAEFPAKWTGNGSRLAKPDVNDWYETVKINYGITPDGRADYPLLPADYAQQPVAAHYLFWQQRLADDSTALPSSWHKFNDIAQYWLAKGVDGFRYDMAEMVPVEFWSYLNSHIKHTSPEAFILAEVYTPALYRDYIHLGKMDYLYDKVGLYDTLKGVIQGKVSTAQIEVDRQNVQDIAPHMLHFLENHDEQRIASPEFAGDAVNAFPAMVVSATLSASPTLIYFGQEVGEDGSEHAGFGQASRTSIFDYIGVPAHQRWMNEGQFDGGQSTDEEKQLRSRYQRLLQLSRSLPAISSNNYFALDDINRQQQLGYQDKVFAFARFETEQEGQKTIVISHFDDNKSASFPLVLPKSLTKSWQLAPGQYQLIEHLDGRQGRYLLTVDEQGQGWIPLELAPLQSLILVLEAPKKHH